MEDSPYSPPKAQLAPGAPGKPDIPWLTNLLGILVLLPAAMALISLPVLWRDLFQQVAAAPLKMSVGLCGGGVMLFGGGLLLALRRMCVLLLGVSAAIGLVNTFIFQQPAPGNLAWLAIDLLAFAYSLLLLSRGSLRSRPNNSSKPTPLRGAA